MHKVTFHNIGSQDCIRIDLETAASPIIYPAASRTALAATQNQRQKLWERRLLGEFLAGFDPGHTWTCVEEREQPDFIVEYGGHRIGIEVTELLAPKHGRERAIQKGIADILRNVTSDFIQGRGGTGGIMDGELHSLPQQRSQTADVPRSARTMWSGALRAAAG